MSRFGKSRSYSIYPIAIEIGFRQGEDKIIGVRFYCTTFPERRFYYELDVFKRKIRSADDRLFQEVKRKQINQWRRFNKSQKYASRTAKLYYICQLYQHLSRLAQDFNIAIVIVNQVSDYSFESSGSFTEAEAGELDYPLNLDFQTAVSSGWDSRTIYNSIPTANITLKNEEIENLEME